MTSSVSYCAEFEETWKAEVYYTNKKSEPMLMGRATASI